MTQTTIKERPILFSGPMVKAILEGKKTQTRRIVKPQPGNMNIAGIKPWVITDNISSEQQYDDQGRMLFIEDNGQGLAQYWTNRYGEPGDQLWVRETFNYVDGEGAAYKATNPEMDGVSWRPSIHMPRVLSRIQLEVTGVRVKRLQDISEDDAIAEGIVPWFVGYKVTGYSQIFQTAQEAYAALWEHINGEGSWEANPWVWVIEFKRVRP